MAVKGENRAVKLGDASEFSFGGKPLAQRVKGHLNDGIVVVKIVDIDNEIYGIKLLIL